MAMEKKIAILAGDGIGPEVMTQARRVLDVVAQKFGHKFDCKEGLIGGAAFDEFQTHFPDDTRAICEASDAILFGSVGGPVADVHLPKWAGCEANSLLSIRKAFSFHANFRPAKVYPELMEVSPLKPELLKAGVDLLVVRELIGDIYFGEHKRFERDGKRVATDVAEYTEDQVIAVAHAAFEAARKRRSKVTSVDKANVLWTSKLWREVVNEVATNYKDVEFEVMLVDNCAMQLVRNPAQFDVILTTNMFGDILSDQAAVLPGSLGLMPSASFNTDGFGFYEPSGGSAPDIAGKNIANPIAQILSVAMMLRYSFGMLKEADSIQNAIDATISAGYRTADILTAASQKVGTTAFTDQVIERL